jgi:hypothetical protein
MAMMPGYQCREYVFIADPVLSPFLSTIITTGYVI